MRGECIFLISDGYQLIGEQAMTMCAKAEPLRKIVCDAPRDGDEYSCNPDACHAATHEIDAQDMWNGTTLSSSPDFRVDV